MSNLANTTRHCFYVVREGYGRVTVPMSNADCQAYIAGAEANGGSGYSVHVLAL